MLLIIFLKYDTGIHKEGVMILLGTIFFLFSGSNEVISAGMDWIHGSVQISLYDCIVVSSISSRGITRLYYLTGTDKSGKVCRFKIDRDTYRIYENQYDFDVDFLVWEQSRVIKEIN